ncbi:MAG TPA: hypothetical protein VMW91_05360 [Desulfosporosinus sp.]|nr:hypothetical protein [Desulfosporosinus sp.]
MRLQKRIFFDRAVIKLDSRALSYGGAVYKVPSRHHGTLPSMAVVPSRHPWLQGHLTILGQRSNLERPVRVLATGTLGHPWPADVRCRQPDRVLSHRPSLR